MKKLQVTQNSMPRNILRIRVKDKVSLDQIYSKTKAKKIWGIVKTLKMRYAGHIVRGNKQKWSHILTAWVPHRGKRKRGRPRTRLTLEQTGRGRQQIEQTGRGWSKHMPRNGRPKKPTRNREAHLPPMHVNNIKACLLNGRYLINLRNHCRFVGPSAINKIKKYLRLA